MRYVFITLVLSFFLLLMAYIILKGVQALSFSSFWSNFYIVSAIVFFLLFLTGMFLGSHLPLPLAKTITFIGYSFLLILIYLSLSFLSTDITLLFSKLFHFSKTNNVSFRFWMLMISLTVIFISMIVGRYRFNHPEIVKLNITVEKPLQNKEIKIVAVSDIHLGISIDKNRLKQYVELINAQHPDLVLIAGDLIDRNIKTVIQQKMDEELLQINAPLGIYAIYGNHEYYAETISPITDFFRKTGITLLKDSMVLVQNQFYLAGREDKMFPNRKKLQDILQHTDTSKPIILLDHQPYHLEDAVKNRVDLQISGHTHDGQFFPGNIIVKWMYELPSGYLKKGNTHFYVSSGLGIWGPQYRIGTKSDLAVINFKY